MFFDSAKLNENFAMSYFNNLVTLLDRLRVALAGAVEDEATHLDQAAEIPGEQGSIQDLPEPSHLEPGELKYGNGIHDYF